MTRKINRDFMFVIAVAVFLTVFFTTVLSYRSFQEEVFSELSSFAQMLEDLEILGQMKEQGFLNRRRSCGSPGSIRTALCSTTATPMTEH